MCSASICPRTSPERKLAAYIHELLQDDRVQVMELWKRLVVAAPWWHTSVLLDLINWKRHVFVCCYHTRVAAVY